MRTRAPLPLSYSTPVSLLSTDGAPPSHVQASSVPLLQASPGYQEAPDPHFNKHPDMTRDPKQPPAPIKYEAPVRGGDDHDDTMVTQLGEIHDLLCKLTGVIAAIGAACVVLLMAIVMKN